MIIYTNAGTNENYYDSNFAHHFSVILRPVSLSISEITAIP